MRSPTLASLLIAIAPLAPAATAQEPGAAAGCAPDWASAFGASPESSALAFAVFDDGSGPALFAGGSFEFIGGVKAEGVARWDGQRWASLGSGVDGTVTALAVFNDGAGEALYVGGVFENAGGAPALGIARWDGSEWSALGSGVVGGVEALAVFDDGSGPALYVAGSVSQAGGVPVNNIARWDGSAWSSVGAGLGDPALHNSSIFALAVFDDGAGAALYAGGILPGPGGSPVNRIARWDGAEWSSTAFDALAPVRSFAVFDAGAGPAMYAGVGFSVIGSQTEDPLFMWTGSEWAPATSGASFGNRNISSMIVYDDGAGPALFVSGDFQSLDNTTVSNIARFDGAEWTSVGNPTDFVPVFGGARALAVFDDGAGTALFASRITFGDTPGSSFTGIGRWTGAEWKPLSDGLVGGQVTAIGSFDDGSGPALYVSGGFSSTGGADANRLAKWDSAIGWTPVGAGLNQPARAFAVFNDGRGDALYLGGAFETADGETVNGVARWDGANMEPLDNGIDGDLNALFGPRVRSMIVFDDGSGPDLYIGGSFDSVSGAPADGVARWDGSAWSPVGAGPGDNSGISSFAVFNAGAGPALHALGSFPDGAGGFESRIARWDGAEWSFIPAPVGVTPDTSIGALAVFNDGAGDALYAALLSSDANNNIHIPSVARWDGAEWTNLPGDFASARLPFIFDLGVFNDGSGDALYAVGQFSSIDDLTAVNIARWDGAEWSALGAGVGVINEFGSTDDSASALAVFDAGAGPALAVGGRFQASPAHDSNIALYQGCAASEPPAPNPDINGDGAVNGTDLLILLNQFGGAGAADLNNDGVVDGTDLLILLNAFGAGG